MDLGGWGWGRSPGTGAGRRTASRRGVPCGPPRRGGVRKRNADLPRRKERRGKAEVRGGLKAGNAGRGGGARGRGNVCMVRRVFLLWKRSPTAGGRRGPGHVAGGVDAHRDVEPPDGGMDRTHQREATTFRSGRGGGGRGRRVAGCVSRRSMLSGTVTHTVSSFHPPSLRTCGASEFSYLDQGCRCASRHSSNVRPRRPALHRGRHSDCVLRGAQGRGVRLGGDTRSLPVTRGITTPLSPR